MADQVKALRDVLLVYGDPESLAPELAVATGVLGASALEYLNGEALRFGFRSATVLLKILKATCSLISGSMALAAIHPRTFSPHDIDFYVSERDVSTLQCFLLLFGYLEVPTRTPEYLPPTPRVIKTVFTYARYDDSGEITTTVNIICHYRRYHPLECVVGFHSTLVMNVIAWHGVICLYPSWTIAKKGLVVIDTAKTRRCFEKYTRRGFFFFDFGIDFVRGLQERSLREDNVLHIPFGQGGIMGFDWCNIGPFAWRLADTAYASPVEPVVAASDAEVSD
ncbi:hypothetical protein CPC08DRAFT_770665 [Agrocybe pediades]|nr:hypothetical protein CPC08DRAFT_770665 [Agrocybe pediades]